MRFSKRWAVATAAVAMSVSVVSCGPSGSKKNQTSKDSSAAAPDKKNAATAVAINPCALLTKADARKILGAAVTDGRITEDVGFAPGTACTYFTSAPIEVAGGTWSVAVEVYDQATFDSKGSYFKSPTLYFHRNYKAMKSVTNSGLKDVKDVGAEAYWSGGQLYVLDRGVVLVFTLHAKFDIPPGPRDKVDAEVDAAALQASIDLAKNVVLPRLEKR